MYKFLRWWQGGPIPRVHVFIPKERRPKGFYQIIRVYFRKWFVHPIKRRVARYWLKILQRLFGLQVIALTGSVGKTTTKEMLLSALSQKYRTIATEANIDPVFNIPTTILRARPGIKILILEMGIEYPGEMDFYLWLAQPNVALLTNLNITHTEFFGNPEVVAQEKTKLVQAIDKAGRVFLNKDDRKVAKTEKDTQARVVFYGTSREASVRGDGIEFTNEFETRFNLKIGGKAISIKIPILGEQNVSNALAAAAAGWAFGVSLEDIKRGLESFNQQPHRMQPIKLSSGAWLIDDTYNSNPLALEKSLETLSRTPAKRRIAVLGEMKELGDLEESSHKKAGKIAGQLRISEVIGYGSATEALVKQAEAGGAGKSWLAKSKKEIVEYLKQVLRKGDVVLIKGSRSVEMEDIVNQLTR